MDRKLLELLHLADSALPIGAQAHSFGLEALVEDGGVTTAQLEAFLRGWLSESGAMEAWFCRRVQADEVQADPARWFTLNEELSAAKVAREPREASLTLGRRFLDLARRFVDLPGYSEAHHALAFGLVGRALQIDPASVVAAYLHQSAAAMISAAQRLMPLGQFEAARLLWELKPLMVSIAVGQDNAAGWQCCTPALDLASFRHPSLETRLFIS